MTWVEWLGVGKRIHVIAMDLIECIFQEWIALLLLLLQELLFILVVGILLIAIIAHETVGHALFEGHGLLDVLGRRH